MPRLTAINCSALGILVFSICFGPFGKAWAQTSNRSAINQVSSPLLDNPPRPGSQGPASERIGVAAPLHIMPNPQTSQRRDEISTAKKKPFQSSTSHDFDVRVAGGYDSNPLRLNRNVSSSVFGRLRLRYDLSHRITKRRRVFADARLSASSYDIEEADRQDGRITLGLRDSSIKLGTGRMPVRLGARFGFRRLTFVDQATGAEETSSGAPIGDRFDANWYEGFTGLRVGVTESTTLTLNAEAKVQDYVDDFTELGIDRLDYTQYAVEPGLRQKLGGGFSARLDVPVKLRVYEDRRAEDLLGNDIAGSDLKYFYYGGEARLTLRDGKRLRLTAGTSAEQRVDNESGIDDRTTIAVYGRGRFVSSEGAQWTFGVKWSRRAFDEIDVGAVDGLNDGGRVKEGVRARASYSHPIVRTGAIDLNAFLRGRYETFSNSDVDFEYDRYQASAGLRLKF